MQVGGAWAKVMVLGELPSAAGQGVAPVSAAPGMVVGSGVVLGVGTRLEEGFSIVESLAAEPLSPPRLISATIPEMANAAMGMRMMYIPVRLRLCVRAWRARSSKRCWRLAF